MGKEQRQFERYEVSIPCTITHMGETIRGEIANISLGGVLITELTGPPPPEKAFITVNFQVDQMALTHRNVAIKASVGSNVVRNLFDIQDDVGDLSPNCLTHVCDGAGNRNFIAFRLMGVPFLFSSKSCLFRMDFYRL